MIPIHLTISGFLSYKEPVELDFTTFDLACIAGANGAGKSSLLDAMTWALFGQARKRDDSLIHTQCEGAEVTITFHYEGNVYRVQRSKIRNKTTLLEFHILQGSYSGNGGMLSGSWKPLTERTLRETEARIQSTLRLDYETFVNAAFFLQGKADQFTQQRPGDRKRILGSILGLEVWERYRQKASERRKQVEAEIAGLDGRLHEIKVELDEEDHRKANLKRLEETLQRLSEERKIQESTLENVRTEAARLAEHRKLVDSLARQLESARKGLERMEARATERRQERDEYAGILAQEEAIRAAYEEWQKTREELARWEEIAGRFREQEKRREGPRAEINETRARLEEERKGLQAQANRLAEEAAEIEDLRRRAEEVRLKVEAAEADLARREELDAELQAARQEQAEAMAENPRLRAEMDELKERIERLRDTEGAECPLCGQPLEAEDRIRLIDQLQERGKEMGDSYRANQALMRSTEERVRELAARIGELTRAEAELRAHSTGLAQINSRIEMLERQAADWQASGQPRLQELERLLAEEGFAPEARAKLAEIDAGLKEIGYDAAEHDRARRAEASGRASEAQLRELEKAQAALAPLERELGELEDQIEAQAAEVARQEREHQEAAANLAAAEAQAPDLYAAERNLLQVREQENRLRMEVGAARQKVAVLKDLKARRDELRALRGELSERVADYRQLERAFGKDGVPALLIEQALPQIEAKANEILERLSAGNMSVRFVTQAEYKDKRRDDLRETLDIQISDGAGLRDYEMYSGGEAFRVNFAIRLALSEVLAQRAGARLQTLVIDEGFGSQDALGRQRLIEAINMVRPDFEKILVITHIDELKDAFPHRIEVDKTPEGSRIRVT